MSTLDAKGEKKFRIKCPDFCQSEQRYVLDVVLGEFLGLSFDVEFYEGNWIEFTRSNESGDAVVVGSLTLDASFFHKAHQDWLKAETMPFLPLSSWLPKNDGIYPTLAEPTIPILYGAPGLVREARSLHINLDIFGSAFLCCHVMKN